MILLRSVSSCASLFKRRRRCFSSPSSSSSRFLVSPHRRSNLIFGANTDVGKTLVSAGLVQASLYNQQQQQHNIKGDNSNSAAVAAAAITRYIKPLQCGGSDEAFVQRHILDASLAPRLQALTLFNWETPTSPHIASLRENKPTSDSQVLEALMKELSVHEDNNESSSTSMTTTTYIETAGGVLSPSSASPDNDRPYHAQAKLSEDDSSSSSSASWGWQTQADLYQPLLGQLPVVLVGDGRLGGISATLAALESLILRGYDIAAIVVIKTSSSQDGEVYDNVSALRQYASRTLALRSGSGDRLLMNPMQSIVSLPPIPSDPNEPLHDWYASPQVSGVFRKLDNFLAQAWQGQVSDLQVLTASGTDVLWWPFTQHGNIQTTATATEQSEDGSGAAMKTNVTLIDSASGDYYVTLKSAQSNELERVALFDACASWWTQGVGHGTSTMALASAAAAGRYGHVIFPEVVHAPAVALSERLLGTQGPGYGWADRVFFTDDGSTAMEVSIKMGMKLYQTRMKLSDDERDEIEWMVCAQADCYHGDTLGVMDVAEPSVYNQGQTPWYEPKGLFLQTPTLGYREGILEISHPEGWEPTNGASSTFDSIEKAMNVNARMISRSLFSHYKETIELQWLVYEHSGGPHRKIGCVLFEPVFMGAGGMKFVDPLWQRALMDIAEARNIPVIFDEVASGLHRVGVTSCREILGADPDIASYAKLLTGGLLPMSVTLATDETFNAFLGDEKGQALLHGHSYTAHPIGCVSSLHALEAYDALLVNHDKRKGPRMWFNEDDVKAMSHLPYVETTFTLGTVLAVTLESDDGSSGYDARSPAISIVQKLREEGVFARPLGNVVYIMASPMTSKDECSRLLQMLHRVIENLSK